MRKMLHAKETIILKYSTHVTPEADSDNEAYLNSNKRSHAGTWNKVALLPGIQAYNFVVNGFQHNLNILKMDQPWPYGLLAGNKVEITIPHNIYNSIL